MSDVVFRKHHYDKWKTHYHVLMTFRNTLIMKDDIRIRTCTTLMIPKGHKHFVVVFIVVAFRISCEKSLKMSWIRHRVIQEN